MKSADMLHYFVDLNQILFLSLESLSDLQMLLNFKIPLRTSGWKNVIRFCSIIKNLKQICVLLLSTLVFPTFSCSAVYRSCELCWKLVEQPLSQ
jgi:hypothetical protein